MHATRTIWVEEEMSEAVEATQSTKPELQRIPFGATVDEVMAAIRQDGGVILGGALSRDEVDAVNRELDPYFGTTLAGGFGEGGEDALKDFMGRRTKRLVHCLKYSPTYRDRIVGNPTLARYVEAMCPGEAGHHALIASHGIEIYPGETAQELHRDGATHLQMLDLYRAKGPDVLVNALLALTDITEEMGATRVVPGSHLWEDFSAAATQDQTIPALLRAGDILLISGKVYHGGGANVTKDRSRRVISTGFAVPFFMGEEAWPFAISVEEARTYPEQVQNLIGFRSISYRGEHPGFLWRVDTRPLEDKLEL
jgi:ectoine hydroxylase-related dioxygenase (phytanoyl-CoA dioxygenase family)